MNKQSKLFGYTRVSKENLYGLNVSIDSQTSARFKHAATNGSPEPDDNHLLIS
jgi:hypothetical protein